MFAIIYFRSNHKSAIGNGNYIALSDTEFSRRGIVYALSSSTKLYDLYNVRKVVDDNGSYEIGIYIKPFFLKLKSHPQNLYRCYF